MKTYKTVHRLTNYQCRNSCCIRLHAVNLSTVNAELIILYSASVSKNWVQCFNSSEKHCNTIATRRPEGWLEEEENKRDETGGHRIKRYRKHPLPIVLARVFGGISTLSHGRGFRRCRAGCCRRQSSKIKIQHHCI